MIWKKICWFGFVAITPTIFSCQFFDTEELQAAFIRVTDVVVTSNDSQGAPTENVVDIWLYVDNELAGSFPLDAVIPVVLQNKIQAFSFSAGIRKNGIQSSPIIYPFYSSFESQLQLQEITEESVSIQFSYLEETRFRLVEGFEGAHSFQEDIDGDPSSSMGISDSVIRSGNRSGHILLDNSTRSIEVATRQIFSDLPINGNPVFLEMDYKNEVDIFVGLQGISSNGTTINFYKLGLKPSVEWNKVYIDFTQDIIDSGLKGFRILIRSSIEDGSASSAEVFIDNVKLLHL